MDMELARNFLSAFYADVMGPDLRLGLFSLPSRRSAHFATTHEAVAFAAQSSAENVYFQAALSAKNWHKKATASDIGAVVILAWDVDAVGPGREGKALPQTVEEALKLLESCPLPPSCIVLSGHGYYPIWRLREPIYIKTEQDREEAERLSKGWHAFGCDLAKAKNWAMENLGDLARVFRLPGSINRKGSPVPAKILNLNAQLTYNHSDFDPYMQPISHVKTKKSGCRRDLNYLLNCLLKDPKIKQTWNKKREDLTDQSQSGYDMSLAALATAKGLSDEEIQFLLLQFRQHHNENPEKALREDYVSRTIEVARTSLRTQNSNNPPDYTVKTDEPSEDRQFPPPVISSPKTLLGFDVTHDPSCLVGRRWICKGTAHLFVGPSGIGKSTLIYQMAILFGLGHSFFGIRPVRPLRVVIFQSENDQGDLAEIVRGIINGLGYVKSLEEINQNLVFVTENSRTGDDILILLRDICATFKPDLIVLDPIMSFIGADLCSHEVIASFFRGKMTLLLRQLDAAMLLVHHTRKMKGSQDAKSMTTSDYSYFGFGSSDLTNWVRSVTILREVEGNIYEFRLAKRGTRAGLRQDPSPVARETNHIFLGHSQTGDIFWVQEFPEKKEPGRKSNWKQDDVVRLSACGMTYSELVVRLRETLGISRATAERAIQRTEADGRIAKTGDKFFPTHNDQGDNHGCFESSE